MKTRIVILILIAMLALGMTASAAAWDPPWPAQVYIPKDGLCWVTWGRWVNSEEGPTIEIYDTEGKGVAVFSPREGVWNAVCQGTIDFSEPDVVSIEDACGAFSAITSCSKSTFKLDGFLECSGDYNVTYDTHYTVSPSGRAKLECHFNPVRQGEP